MIGPVSLCTLLSFPNRRASRTAACRHKNYLSSRACVGHDCSWLVRGMSRLEDGAVIFSQRTFMPTGLDSPLTNLYSSLLERPNN
jgi:hypothetical protein